MDWAGTCARASAMDLAGHRFISWPRLSRFSARSAPGQRGLQLIGKPAVLTDAAHLRRAGAAGTESRSTMRNMHRTALSLAGIVLAAATAVGAVLPAGAAEAATMTFPQQFSEGTLVNVNSGKCLQPSRDAALASHDLIVQATCDGTVLQSWELIPVGTVTTQTQWPFSYGRPGWLIKNAASGMCMDDRGGASFDGAPVQQFPCSTTNSNQQWVDFLAPDGNDQIGNAHATVSRDVVMVLEIPAGLLDDGIPVELYRGQGQSPPLAQEFQYNVEN